MARSLSAEVWKPYPPSSFGLLPRDVDEALYVALLLRAIRRFAVAPDFCFGQF
jgi:hypothetical protein